MSDRRIMSVGIVGSIVAAICCFTPILVVGLGAVGLGAWLAWSDFVLLPALVLFVAITIYGWRRQRRDVRHATE